MRFCNVAGKPAVLVADRAHPIPTGALAAGVDPFIAAIADWTAASTAALAAEPIRFAPTDLGAPVPRPGKILGAPVNYEDHQREMNAAHTIAGLGFFLKSPSSIVGPDGAVPLPFPDRRTDQEAELGVVIGTTASNVTIADALDCVFGYTCLIDVTVRGDEERSTRKSFPGFTPIGPWVTTAEEIPDPTDLRIQGWVGDELRQDESSAAMVYGVAALIEFMSTVVTLEPGDIIATGTPAGVGPVVAGDVIRVRIDRVGELTVPVVAGDRDPHPLWSTRT